MQAILSKDLFPLKATITGRVFAQNKTMELKDILIPAAIKASYDVHIESDFKGKEYRLIYSGLIKTFKELITKYPKGFSNFEKIDIKIISEVPLTSKRDIYTPREFNCIYKFQSMEKEVIKVILELKIGISHYNEMKWVDLINEGYRVMPVDPDCFNKLEELIKITKEQKMTEDQIWSRIIGKASIIEEQGSSHPTILPSSDNLSSCNIPIHLKKGKDSK